MKRWLRRPLMFLSLLALWLLLNQSLAPGQVLLGAVLALGGTALAARLQPPRGRIRMLAIAQLLGLVFADVVRSNLAVGRIVLGLGTHDRTAGFVSIPLELRDPRGLAVMACIITATPGTSWASYDAGRGILVIHVLDFVDEQAWLRTVKQGYERRLLEIFA